MTDPILPPSLPPTPLPSVPLDQVVYQSVSTDHYPWTEVLVDLAARQAQDFSGVFDARQEDRWARFVWLGGQLLGGFTRDGLDVQWTNTMQALPRATITLAAVQPAVAQVIWACRAALGQHLTGAWPDVRFKMEHETFYGLLVSGGASSYWVSGRVVGGTLPPVGGVCQVFSPNVDSNRDTLVTFWQELIRAVHAAVPLDDHWRQVVVRLSDDFPCLDPFAREVTVQGGRLSIDPAVTVAEFRPAMQAALRAMLARVGVRLGDLNVGDLRGRVEWAASGLEAR